MQFEYNGQTFDIEQVENDNGSITVNITHLKPQPVKSTHIEKRNQLVEVDTGKKDDEGRPVLTKKNEVTEVAVETETIEMTPIKIGSFIMWAEVDRRTMKSMLRNWSNNSSKMQKITTTDEN